MCLASVGTTLAPVAALPRRPPWCRQGRWPPRRRLVQLYRTRLPSLLPLAGPRDAVYSAGGGGGLVLAPPAAPREGAGGSPCEQRPFSFSCRPLSVSCFFYLICVQDEGVRPERGGAAVWGTPRLPGRRAWRRHPVRRRGSCVAATRCAPVQVVRGGRRSGDSLASSYYPWVAAADRRGRGGNPSLGVGLPNFGCCGRPLPVGRRARGRGRWGTSCWLQ